MDQKISLLNAIVLADDTDELVIVDTGGTETKKISLSALRFNIFASPNSVAVDMVSTANITLSGVQNLDGQTGAAGTSKVMVWKQTDPTQNGIYIQAAGAWSRSTDSDSSAELDNQVVFANYPLAGSTYGGGYFNQLTTTPTIAADDIIYEQGGTTAATGAGWRLQLNNTSTTAKFGTSNNRSVPIYTAGIQRGTIFNTGELGWGITASPLARVHIKGVGTSTSRTFLLEASDGTDNFIVLDDGSFSLGYGTTPGWVGDVRIGYTATTTGNGGIAIGLQATAGTQSVAVGYQATSSGTTSVAIGSATATQAGAHAIGYGAQATGIDAQAFGELCRATGQGSIMIGGSNQGAITNDVNGSVKIGLSWFNSNSIAKEVLFLYNTGNLVLNHGGSTTQSMLQPAWTAPFDYVAENTLTLHNAKVPTAITVTSVVNNGGAAFFAHAGTSNFTQSESGCLVTLSGSAVYANGVYYAHWQSNSQLSLHPTRTDAVAISNSLAYISDEATGTLTFNALNPDATGLIANAAQLFAKDNGANNSSFYSQTEAGLSGLVGLIETKTTTGDPTGYEGRMVINTTDNTFKIYADAAWRTITTW